MGKRKPEVHKIGEFFADGDIVSVRYAMDDEGEPTTFIRLETKTGIIIPIRANLGRLGWFLRECEIRMCVREGKSREEALKFANERTQFGIKWHTDENGAELTHGPR